MVRNLKSDTKKVLGGIVESMGATYVGKKRYSIDALVRAFEYSKTYNCLRQDLQPPSISIITKMTSNVKTILHLFLVH